MDGEELSEELLEVLCGPRLGRLVSIYPSVSKYIYKFL